MNSILPAPRVVRAVPEGPGIDLALGGLVTAPRTWWPRIRVILRAIEDGTGAAFTLADPGVAATDAVIAFDDIGPAGTADSVDPGSEGYTLTVARGWVRITARTSAGAFYAGQTLRQLLPARTFRRALVPGRASVVEPIDIVDAPLVGWRGAMLDVSRHFYGKAWTLKLIDLLAMHKLNVLYLHLTDDQGWRMQIDAFPRLTDVGAWRRETLVGYRFSEDFDGKPYGGFFTKDDLREIVAYADDRGITVVPEIDMPGHLLAAVAAYPEWGVTGRQTEALTRWGVSHDVLNLEDATVEAMKTILDEVIEVFPSRYIHIGGDECPRSEWIESARVQELIRERGLADEAELQHWFTRQLGEHLAARGRTLLGWDEILNSDLPDNATVMAWRDEQYAREALEQGRDVVIATQEHLYFDFKQSADEREPLGPRIFGIYLTELREVYDYQWLAGTDPAVLERQVLGAQVHLWTEFADTGAKAEYLLFPRTCAFADRAWSGARDDFEGFLGRLRPHLERLGALDVSYRGLDGPTQGQSDLWWGVRAEVPPRLMLSSNDSATGNTPTETLDASMLG